MGAGQTGSTYFCHFLSFDLCVNTIGKLLQKLPGKSVVLTTSVSRRFIIFLQKGSEQISFIFFKYRHWKVVE